MGTYMINLTNREMRALEDSFIVYEDDANGVLFEFGDKSLGNGLELYLYTTLTGTDDDRIVYGRVELLDEYGEEVAKTREFYGGDVREGVEHDLFKTDNGSVFGTVELVVG